MINVLEKIISDKKESLSLIKKRKTLESLNRNIKELKFYDFKEAIKCGSTHIRIGTSIFGKRL